MVPFLATWRHALAHGPTRLFFLLVLLTPAAFVLLAAVAWPTMHALRSFPDEEAVQDEAPTAIPPEEQAARHRLLTLMDSLKTVRAFTSVRLALAQQEEISLALDLVDSVLSIDIQGVSVRRVKIQHLTMSEVLERARTAGRLPGWLEEPFTLVRADATIPRIPVRVVDAPRDSAEAAARPPEDIPVESGETHFALAFDRGLTLHVEQPSTAIGFFKKALLKAKGRIRTAAGAVQHVARGQAPEQEAWIALTLSPEDAKALYRALPDNARLALRL